VNENHYRYYQYYANSQVAVLVWVVLMLSADAIEHSKVLWFSFGALQLLLFFASHDALKKNDEKLCKILGTTNLGAKHD